jgi:NADPH-dependent ferric siderophore reductase
MDDYPYTTLGADGWFRCDGLHRPVFPTLLRDVLHRFGYTRFPVYCGRPYRQFRMGRCKVHVDVLAHPTDLTMAAWFTTARGDDLDDTLERAAHQALMELCERHLPALGDTTIALLPIQN